MRDAVEHELAAQHLGAAAKASLPRRVAQNRERRRSRPVLLLGKEPAQHGLNTQDSKKSMSGLATDDALRLPLPGQSACAGPWDDCHLLKYSVLFSPVKEVTVTRPLVLAADVACVDADNAVRIRESIWIEKKRIHRTEDRGVCADSDGKRQESDGGECRTLAEHSETIAHILHQELEKAESTCVTALFLDFIEPAKHNPGPSICFLLRHPRFQVLVDLEVKVKAQLFFQFRLYGL